MKNLRSLLTLLILLSSVYSDAQEPRTFYIGHSLSDQIPDMVQSLSNDHQDVDFSWVYQSIPGSPLRYNWDRKIDEDYGSIEPHYYGFYDQTYGLRSGNFDVLVLTESVPRNLNSINETYAYADSFYRYANEYNPDIQVYLYEDWHCLLSGTPTGCDYDFDSNPWRQRLTDDLPMWESVVDTLNARFDPTNPVCLIPAGQGLAALADAINAGQVPEVIEIEQLFSDEIHLTDIGKYFIACIHFATIHKTSPVGLTNQLQVWWGGDFEAPSLDLAEKLQEIAWDVAVNYPRSCISNSPNSIVEREFQFTVSPNPTSGQLKISEVPAGYLLSIYDLQGEIQYECGTKATYTKVDISQLASGFYFVKVMNENGEVMGIKKIVKQ